MFEMHTIPKAHVVSAQRNLQLSSYDAVCVGLANCWYGISLLGYSYKKQYPAV